MCQHSFTNSAFAASVDAALRCANCDVSPRGYGTVPILKGFFLSTGTLNAHIAVRQNTTLTCAAVWRDGRDALGTANPAVLQRRSFAFRRNRIVRKIIRLFRVCIRSDKQRRRALVKPRFNDRSSSDVRPQMSTNYSSSSPGKTGFILSKTGLSKQLLRNKAVDLRLGESSFEK